MELPIRLENCDVKLNGDLDPGRNIAVIPQSHDSVLSDKQLVDYKEQRIKFLSWLLNVGKNPERATGYSEYTVYSTAYRTANFDKWVWENRGGYHYPPTEEDASAFLEHLAYGDSKQTKKGKLQEGIQHLNKWLRHNREIGRASCRERVYCEV